MRRKEGGGLRELEVPLGSLLRPSSSLLVVLGRGGGPRGPGTSVRPSWPRCVAELARAKLADGAGRKPHFRALEYSRRAVANNDLPFEWPLLELTTSLTRESQAQRRLFAPKTLEAKANEVRKKGLC